MEELLLKPDEVAEILKISKAQTYAFLKRGEIPVIRLGTLVRVRPRDLEKYIDDKARQKDSVEAPANASRSSG